VRQVRSRYLRPGQRSTRTHRSCKGQELNRLAQNCPPPIARVVAFRAIIDGSLAAALRARTEGGISFLLVVEVDC
jgi:hypothetical protein